MANRHNIMATSTTKLTLFHSILLTRFARRSALASLTVHSSKNRNESINSCQTWVKQLYDKCEQKLEAFMNTSTKNFSNLDRALFTVGEASMVGFFADDDVAPEGSLREKQSTANAKNANDSDVCISEWTRGLYVQPSNKLIEFVHFLLPPKMPHNVGGSGNITLETPSSARALAFVALGKLCLRNANLAKDAVNILARELHFDKNDVETSCGGAAVRSNALVVLGDLCVRYTSLVDRQLPAMAECLQDGVEHGE